MYTVKTDLYTAEIGAFDKNIIKIKIVDEKEHALSGAVLPRKLSKSNLTETDTCFCLTTDEIRAEIYKADGGIKIYDKNGKLLTRTYPEAPYFKGVENGFILNFKLSDGERIYGLGEDNDIAFGRLDRRGTVRDMLTGQRINQNHVTADFPIPFILSSDGEKSYGFYLDNTSNLTIDIGKSVGDRLSINAPAGACEMYFISGDGIPEIVCSYSGMIGRNALPPLWVLGYMQSKCSFWDWEEIDDVILTFKEKGIPLDSVVFDFDWAECFNNYKWAKRWQGKSPEKIGYYREKYGIHFMASNSGPMLKKNSDTFDSAVEAGILAHDKDGNTVTCGHYSGELMDFTNPATGEWIKPQLERIMSDGIEAWWLDLTEPEGDAENTVYHTGSRAEVHNIFSNAASETYHKVSRNAYPNKRSFVLTRTGTAGIQRNPTALWTGDIYSEYGTLQAHIPEALNTQLSGINMWTCDTSGFLSPTNNDDCPYNLYHNDRVEHAQLYERWLQFSCFTPLFRTHHAGGEAVPFRYGDMAFDGMSHYIKLRYRLIPYIYSLYYENYLSGTPIMRPLFWHYPNDEKCRNATDEYLFGEKILVAPVLEAQTNKRAVYLPEGTWYDFDYDYVYEGGREYEIYAPQNRIPVFVKAGGIIPMSREAENTREIDFTSLEAVIYPDGASSFELYADDGETENYRIGGFTRTVISCLESENSIKLSLEANNGKFSLKELTAHIHMKCRPAEIRLDGAEIKRCSRLATVRNSGENIYYFDEFNRILHVKMFFGGLTDLLDITLDREASYRAFEPFCEEKLAGQLPYIYPPAAVPCMIQAIHYDRGGEAVAFHKNNPDTNGVYRDDNAGIAEDENGCYIKNFTAGEWLEYSISVAKEGDYSVSLTGNTNNSEIILSVENSTARLENGRATLNLGTGQKILRIEVKNGSADIDRILIEVTQ